MLVSKLNLLSARKIQLLSFIVLPMAFEIWPPTFKVDIYYASLSVQLKNIANLTKNLIFEDGGENETETFSHLFSNSKSDWSWFIGQTFSIYHLHGNIESGITSRFIVSSSKWWLQEPLGLLYSLHQPKRKTCTSLLFMGFRITFSREIISFRIAPDTLKSISFYMREWFAWDPLTTKLLKGRVIEL